jgi:hypothetical protein
MIREFVVASLVCATGCSLVLDFSDQAIPKDAAADATTALVGCDYKEPNDDFATAAPVTATDTGPAAICTTGDRDFYQVSIPPSTWLAIRLDATYAPGADLDLRLLDAGGRELASSRGFSDEERISCPGSAGCGPLAAGSYVIEVFPGEAGAVDSYRFHVELTTVAN